MAWQPDQQYPPQPGYGRPYMPPQPPYQPPRRKSWAARHKILTGLLSTVGLIAVIGIIAAATSKPPATSPAAASHPAAPSRSPAAAVKPHLVARFAGSGETNTARFTVTGTWKLGYSYNCAALGADGNFAVEEDGGSDFNGVSVNDLGTGKSGTSWAYNDAGTHYLEIISECAWTARVYDEG